MARTQDTIDRELALLACVRAAVAEFGPPPSTEVVDRLLDERLGVGGQS